MSVAISTTPGRWAQYCEGEGSTLDLCTVLGMGDFSLSPWLINADGSPNSIFVEADSGGLIASITSYPDGSLINQFGEVVDIITSSGQNGTYGTLNQPPLITGVWSVVIPNIPVTLKDTSTCTVTFTQYFQSGTFESFFEININSGSLAYTLTSFKTLNIDYGDSSEPQIIKTGGAKSYTYTNTGTYKVRGEVQAITNLSGTDALDYLNLQIFSEQGITSFDGGNLRDYYYMAISNQANMSSVLLGPSNRANFILLLNNTSLTSLDLSGIQNFSSPINSALSVSGCTSLTSLTLPNACPKDLSISNTGLPHNLAWGSIPNFGSIAGFNFLANNNGYTPAQLNELLTILDNATVAGFSGRGINLTGSSGTPDSTSGGFNGIDALNNLIAKGFTVDIS